MAATNTILAKRVDELTDALAEVHDDIREALASGEVHGLEETSEHLTNLLGLQGATENSEEEDDWMMILMTRKRTKMNSEVCENVKEVTQADHMAEATAAAGEIIEKIDEVIGPENDDEDSQEEEVEFGQDSDREPEEEE